MIKLYDYRLYVFVLLGIYLEIGYVEDIFKHFDVKLVFKLCFTFDPIKSLTFILPSDTLKHPKHLDFTFILH